MSPLIGGALLREQSFPRVSGDEPWSAPKLAVGQQFSPRERG